MDRPSPRIRRALERHGGQHRIGDHIQTGTAYLRMEIVPADGIEWWQVGRYYTIRCECGHRGRGFRHELVQILRCPSCEGLLAESEAEDLGPEGLEKKI